MGREVAVGRSGDRVTVCFVRRTRRGRVVDHESHFATPSGPDWREVAVRHAMAEWREVGDLNRRAYGGAPVVQASAAILHGSRLRTASTAALLLACFFVGFIAHRLISAPAPVAVEAENPHDRFDTEAWFANLTPKCRANWLRTAQLGDPPLRVMAFDWAAQEGLDCAIMKAVMVATLDRGDPDRADKVAAREYLRRFSVEHAAATIRGQAELAGADPDAIEAKLRELIHE